MVSINASLTFKIPCSCFRDISTPSSLPLYCLNYSNQRSTLLNITGNIDSNILRDRHRERESDLHVTRALLYSANSAKNITNFFILILSIDLRVFYHINIKLQVRTNYKLYEIIDEMKIAKTRQNRTQNLLKVTCRLYLNRHVTRGGEWGEVSPALFQK